MGEPSKAVLESKKPLKAAASSEGAPLPTLREIELMRKMQELEKTKKLLIAKIQKMQIDNTAYYSRLSKERDECKARLATIESKNLGLHKVIEIFLLQFESMGIIGNVHATNPRVDAVVTESAWSSPLMAPDDHAQLDTDMAASADAAVAAVAAVAVAEANATTVAKQQ
eukprot:ANDGO_05581.mRNA.1 hypothetical protein